MPPTVPAVPNVGDPTTRQFASTLIQAIVDLISLSGGGGGGSSSGSLLLNGSFETDADINGTPDNWTVTLQTAGAFAQTGNGRTDTACVSGSQAIKFTSIGGGSNGGGQIQSDFFEVTPLRPLKIEWLWYCTSTSAANFVKIDFYDAAQSFISPTVTVWQKQSGVNNPSSWTQAFGCAVPPSTARYAKVTLIGCDSSVPTACSTYFDGVAVSNFAFIRKSEFHGNAAGGGGVRTWYFRPPVTGPYRVTCIGGGGGGASDSTNDTGEVGGGSGALAQSVVVLTAGTPYIVQAGNGGAGGNNATGGDGVDSLFGSSLVVGAGGKGGIKNGAGGAGGLATSPTIGDIAIAGIQGQAVETGVSGAGAPSVLGFAGGEGVYRDNGVAPDTHSCGAGGSGGWSFSTTKTGGNGGPGCVIIEW